MAIAIYTPPYLPHPRVSADLTVEKPVVVATFRNGVEQRAATGGRTFRRFEVSFVVDRTNRDRVEAFFLARGYMQESFLWQCPDGDDSATASATVPTTSDGATTAFVITTVGEPGGHYPMALASSTLYRAGVVAALASISTDDRTLTASVAPITGATMTCSYLYYRRFRLAQPYRWIRHDPNVFETTMTWLEVSQ